MGLNELQLRKIIREETGKFLKKRPVRRLLEAENEKEDMSQLDISKGPSATVEWLNGPGADPRVRAVLSAGNADGKPNDEKAKLSETGKTIGSLIPTQVEIELTKSIAFPLSKFKSLKSMIGGGVQRVGPPGNDMIVTSGNLIIDGHHRWSSLFSVAGPNAQIAAVDIKLPEKDAASVLSIVQTAIASTLESGEPVPAAKAGGMNILGKSRDEIADLITEAYESGGGEAGAILTDDFITACMSDAVVAKHFGLSSGKSTKAESRRYGKSLLKEAEEDTGIAAAREQIISKVADNLALMNQPADGAPPRVDMPQLDKAKGGVMGALSNLATGVVNYKEPFTAKESVSSRAQGSVIIERWQKLAGLIK
jgi:hypothetical protein